VLFSPGEQVWTATSSWSWLSLDRDWVWIVIVTWLTEPGSWSWLIVPGSWRIEVSCWTTEVGSSFRVPGGLPSLPIFGNPSLEEDIPTSDSWVTCYPVFYCERHGDISIFLLFICVTVFVYIRRYIVSVLHVRVK